MPAGGGAAITLPQATFLACTRGLGQPTLHLQGWVQVPPHHGGTHQPVNKCGHSALVSSVFDVFSSSNFLFFVQWGV